MKNSKIFALIALLIGLAACGGKHLGPGQHGGTYTIQGQGIEECLSFDTRAYSILYWLGGAWTLSYANQTFTSSTCLSRRVKASVRRTFGLE